MDIAQGMWLPEGEESDDKTVMNSSELWYIAHSICEQLRTYILWGCGWGEVTASDGEIPEGRGGQPDRSPVLAQRAVADSPRWTRAVGDRFRPPS